MEYSELQERGFAIAKTHEKLPLQDRIDIIAQTFGCKTASLKTSPCTGKWRGSSDVCLAFDNGSSLFIGNHLTPKAKTIRVQSEFINNTLARHNPEIVHEAKARAAAALSKREAVDNAIAAEKGLMPYTFLNVELNDGSDELSGSHMGWYYVTLAIDNKIFAFVETGLNYDIARGVLSAEPTRPNYFVAGGLRDEEADFVFNNVAFSSDSRLYHLPLTDHARERAEQRLSERHTPAAMKADEKKPSVMDKLAAAKEAVSRTERSQQVADKPKTKGPEL